MRRKSENRTFRVVSSPSEPYDITKLDPGELRGLCRSTLQATKQYFKLPGVQEDFERWLREDYSKRPGVVVSEEYNHLIQN